MALGHHRVLILLVVICLALTTCLGEDSDQQEHEYVFSIPGIFRYDNPHVMITTSSVDPVIATLSIPGYVLPINRTITRNNGTDIRLPADIRMHIGDGKQNKTVIVRALGAVSVYAISNKWLEGDAFQCIPSSFLGNKYSVASYRPWSTYSSFVCVSALHSPTTVTISNARDIIHTFTLQRYESFRYDGDDDADLSGLLVHSTKAIAVIAGSVPSIPVNTGSADGILAQLTPVASWGTVYFLFPFKSLNAGFVYRVYSYNISTILQMSDGRVEEIQPGEFYEGDVVGDTVVSFKADNPVMVAQYIKGYDANNPGRGDPSMLIVPPVSSYTNHVRFPVFEYSSQHTYYINIVTQCNNIYGLFYDEALSIASWDKLTTDDQVMCCVRSNVSTGYHSVTHTNPNATFFVSVYAICNDYCASSYAYAATGIYEQDQRLTPMITTDTPYQTEQPTESAKQQTTMLRTTDTVSGQTDQPTSEGCPRFTTLDNGLLQPDRAVYNIGQIVTVYCLGGFNLIGDNRLVCTDTGEWYGETPTCIQSNKETSGSVVIISASVGGVVLIALVLIATICYCRKRCKTSADNTQYYSSNLPRPHAAPVLDDNSKRTHPNTDSRDDNEGYETPQDNAAYQDLEMSTMTSSEQEYHGLYTQAR